MLTSLSSSSSLVQSTQTKLLIIIDGAHCRLTYCYARMNLRMNQDHRYFYKIIGVKEIIKCIRLEKIPTINSLYKEAGGGKPRKALAQLLPSCTTPRLEA